MTFLLDERVGIEDITNKELKIRAEAYRERRSKNANALLWHCIGRIAAEVGADKWDIYLKLLKRYGKYTYVCVKPEAVDAVKRQWREVEDIGEININGDKAEQLLCYFGSSKYDTKEMSTLIDETISEMQEMGLDAPTTGEIKRALDMWEESRAWEK